MLKKFITLFSLLLACSNASATNSPYAQLTELAQEKYRRGTIELPDEVAEFLPEGIRDVLTIYDNQVRTGELASIVTKYLNKIISLYARQEKCLPKAIGVIDPDEAPCLDVTIVNGAVAAKLAEYEIPRLFHPKCYPLGSLEKMPERNVLEQFCLSMVFMHHRTLMETCFIEHAKSTNPDFMSLAILPDLCRLHGNYQNKVGPSHAGESNPITLETLRAMQAKWEATNHLKQENLFCLFYGIQANQIFINAQNREGFIDPCIRSICREHLTPEDELESNKYATLLAYELSYCRSLVNIKDLEILAPLPHEKGRGIMVNLLIGAGRIPENARHQLFSDEPVIIPGTGVKLNRIMQARYARQAALRDSKPVIEQLTKDKADQLAQIEELLNLVDKLTFQNRELEARIATRELLEDGKKDRQPRKKELSDEQIEIKQLRGELKELRRKVDKLTTSSGSQKETKQQQEELASIKASLKEKEAEVRRLTQENAAAGDKADKNERTIDNLTAQVRNLKAKSSKLTSQVAELRGQIKEQKDTSLESERAQASLVLQLKDALTKNAALEAKIVKQEKLRKEFLELFNLSSQRAEEAQLFARDFSVKIQELSAEADLRKKAMQQLEQQLATLQNLKKNEQQHAEEQIENLERNLLSITAELLQSAQERDEAEKQRDELERLLSLSEQLRRSAPSLAGLELASIAMLADLKSEISILSMETIRLEKQTAAAENTSGFYQQLAAQHEAEIASLNAALAKALYQNRNHQEQRTRNSQGNMAYSSQKQLEKK